MLARMKKLIRRKLTRGEPGLYIALLFPILFAFVLTFAGSRLISYLITYGYLPPIYWEPEPGVHIHHFAYGIFVLAIAGYLALVFNSPRAKYLIALLFGFGLGLAFDEFLMWFKLRDDAPTRWSYDGFTLVIGTSLTILVARPGLRLLRKLLPVGKRGEPTETAGRASPERLPLSSDENASSTTE